MSRETWFRGYERAESERAERIEQHKQSPINEKENTMSRFDNLDIDDRIPGTFDADEQPVRQIDVDDDPTPMPAPQHTVIGAAVPAPRVARTTPPPPPGSTERVLRDAKRLADQEQAKLRAVLGRADIGEQLYDNGTELMASGIATANYLRAEWEARPVLGQAMADTRQIVGAEQRSDYTDIPLTNHRIDADGMLAERFATGPDKCVPRLPLDGTAWGQLCNRAPDGLPPRLKSNVNLWLPSSPSIARLRTRKLTPTAPRSCYAVLSPKYAAVDLDRVASLVEKMLPRDCHAEVTYDRDSTRWQIDASLANVLDIPGELGVGRMHRIGLRATGADNGTQGVEAKFYAERIRCRNCTIVTAEGFTFRKIHVGNGLEHLFAEAIGKIAEATEVFGSAWRDANTERIHDAYDGSTLGAIETFKRLVAHKYVTLPGSPAEQVETLMQAWNAEPGDTAAACNRAITRAAQGFGAFEAADLEEQAGALLFNRVFELPRLSSVQERSFTA